MTNPTILPIGDNAVLVRFAETLSDDANRAAIGFADRLTADAPDSVAEIAPGLVSVLVRTKPGVDFWRLSGELRLRMTYEIGHRPEGERTIDVVFDGQDLGEVSSLLGLEEPAFVARHNASPLRVLATGFAPGFVYCGFHPTTMVVPRREAVRPMVPAGTVLFAAGQTAIAATPIRTGWHIIGRTAFQNFDPLAAQPTVLRPGDAVRFVES